MHTSQRTNYNKHITLVNIMIPSLSCNSRDVRGQIKCALFDSLSDVTSKVLTGMSFKTTFLSEQLPQSL